MNIYYSAQYVTPTLWNTTKARHIVESLAVRPIRGVTLVEPKDRSGLFPLAHSAEYLSALRSGLPRNLAESNGFGWDATVWRAVRASTSGVIEALEDALSNRRVAGSLSSGLHHARSDHGAALCTLNGLAITAQAVAERGARTLVLDLDAHCGGGTHQILSESHSRTITHIDIATDSLDCYEAGGLDVCHVVRSAKMYLSTIRRTLDRLGVYDVMLYNAGMDPFEQDMVGGLQGIASDVLAAREALVFEWAMDRRMPMAFVLAGGYTGVEQVVDLHRLTIQAAAHAVVEAEAA